ncbi:MAG TPA: hypothetical protein VGO00_04750, partial [Kofleriaceae bacterium]|nr:hypothetical protein [Kofleriaceae bacterium]
MRTSLCLLAGVGSVVMMSPPAAADPPIKVAVVPGIAVNLDAAKVDALSQDLADALASELLVTAVGGLEVRRELPAEGVAPDCVTTPSCVADVARKLGASQLLFVVMVDTGSGGSIQIDSTWVDVATNRTASRPPIDIASPNLARARFVDAAHQLLPDTPLRPKPKHDTLAGGKPRHLTVPSIVTASVGIVGLGIGIGFGMDARSKYNSCNADGVACADDRRTSIRHLDLVA